MTLVSYYRKAYKPRWQDVTPDTPEGKNTYRIAAKYENGFTKAYLKLIRDLLPDKTPKEFKLLYNDGKINDILGWFPFFRLDSDVWVSFLESIRNVYSKVVEDSGREAAKIVNDKFGRNFRFTMNNGRMIQKAHVPINVYSVDWIREHSLELITQGLAVEQEVFVRSTLLESFAQGIRAETVYNDIKDSIGLTDKEYKAVANRKLLHEKAGLLDSEVGRLVAKYREKLLLKRAKRIARTETIIAQAKGRQHAWKMARQEGDLPENVVRVWITPPLSPNPDRPCKICVGLDEKQAPINGSYESAYIGVVDGPPAHPHCRCTESLEVI